MTGSIFLTDLDDRGRVRGSRDPLGAMALWTTVGRGLVSNLTTVTTSVAEFRTLLLGVLLIERTRAAADDEPRRSLLTEQLLRLEQLAAYARLEAGDSVRGVRRVRRWWRDDNTTVTISHRPEHQILGNQRVYGIFGLYVGAARASGLLAAGPALRLEPDGRIVADSILRAVLPYEKVLSDPAGLELAKNDRRLPALASALRGENEPLVVRRLLRERLLFGRPAASGGAEFDTTQERLARLIHACRQDFTSGDVDTGVSRLIARAQTKGNSELVRRLRAAAVCESVLRPAHVFFRFLMSRDGGALDVVAREVSKTWGALSSVNASSFSKLEPVKEAPDAGLWVPLADALRSGDFDGAIDCCARLNAQVMNRRGIGVPWIEVHRKRLRVRQYEGPGALESKASLRTFWERDYFLGSLASLSDQLR